MPNLIINGESYTGVRDYNNLLNTPKINNIDLTGNKSLNDLGINNSNLGNGYGVCSTDEATVAKVVTLVDYSLVKNGYVSVKFTNAVPANATMNINSKGAKAIFHKGAAILNGVIKAGYIGTFIYDGIQYQLVAVDQAVSSGSPTAKIDLVLKSFEPTNPTNGMVWIDASDAEIDVYEFKYQDAEPTDVELGCGWIG